MSNKTNRTIRQIIHDFFEDGVLAFAMSYAVTRGDMSSSECSRRRAPLSVAPQSAENRNSPQNTEHPPVPAGFFCLQRDGAE